MNINLRPALIEDLSELQKLFVDTINEVCASDYSNDQRRVWTSAIENRKQWADKLIHQYFQVAMNEKHIIGFGSLESGYYIDFLYIHKDYQRLGIADKLLTSIESEAKRLGTKLLKSDVSKTAKGFFESRGFKVIMEQTKTVDSIQIVNYKMQKEL